MSQLQARAFRGSDVDGLDRIVRRMTDAAEFADDVVKALKVLAAALDAMSWTGWAAAFARYLRGVVIPWVQTVARYLRGFSQVLALISQTQKDTSSDRPTVHVPATAFTPVTLPATSAAHAPMLTAPATAVSPAVQGGGAAGAGAQVVVPAAIGSVTIHVHGAGGAGAQVTTPQAAPVVRTDAAGGATGGGQVTAPTGGIAPAAAPPVAGGASGGGPGGGPGGGTGGGTGGGSGGPVAPTAAGIGSPPVPEVAASAIDPRGVPGQPVVVATPLDIGGASPGSDGTRAAAAAGMAALETGSGAPIALAAAPLGLAALGAATLGALRSRDGEDEGDDTAPATPAPVPVELTIDRRSGR